MTTTTASTRPVAIVTGARRGIGAAIAIDLARHGFDLALTDLADDGAPAVIDRIAAAGGRATYLQADLAAIAHHDDTLAALLRWSPRIDCLINNAGLPAPERGDLLQVTPAGFDGVLDVNLRGTFFFTQAVARAMLAQPAAGPRAIVTISSVSAELASIERGAYCLSKAALAMLTRLFALRLAPHGIGVFEVRPGVIRTPMTAGVAPAYDARIAAGLVPMQRWGEPEDVARVVSQLAAGGFAFATGSVIHADGGLAIPRL